MSTESVSQYSKNTNKSAVKPTLTDFCHAQCKYCKRILEAVQCQASDNWQNEPSCRIGAVKMQIRSWNMSLLEQLLLHAGRRCAVTQATVSKR